MAAKVRPCVVVSVSNPDRQRSMSVVVPMTTEIRGGECEIRFSKPVWLRQESVVNVMGIAGVNNANNPFGIQHWLIGKALGLGHPQNKTGAENFSAPGKRP